MPEWLKQTLRMFTDGRRNVERGFFAWWFRTTDEDYTNAEYVEIDTERTTNVVAPTLRMPLLAQSLLRVTAGRKRNSARLIQR